MKPAVFLIILMFFLVAGYAHAVNFNGNGTAAGEKASPGSRTVSAVGIIEKQGITIYMYGTHVLINDNGKTLYAVKSGSINLDKYIGKKVTIKGFFIKGYPVDNGPYFINVKAIELQTS